MFKDAVINRVLLVLATSIASSFGAFLAVAQPVIHSAICMGPN